MSYLHNSSVSCTDVDTGVCHFVRQLLVPVYNDMRAPSNDAAHSSGPPINLLKCRTRWCKISSSAP